MATPLWTYNSAGRDKKISCPQHSFRVTGLFPDTSQIPDYAPLKLDTYMHPAGAWLLLSVGSSSAPDETVIARCSEILEMHNKKFAEDMNEFGERVHELQSAPRKYADTPGDDDVKVEVINPKATDTVRMEQVKVPQLEDVKTGEAIPRVPEELRVAGKQFVAVAVVFSHDGTDDVLVNVLDAFPDEAACEDYIRTVAAARFKNVDLYCCSMYEWLTPDVLHSEKTSRFTYREPQLDAIMNTHEKTQRELSAY